MDGLRFSLFGIPVVFSPQVGLLAGVFFLLGLSWGWSLPLIGAVIAIAVVSILVHELGHAVAARILGLQVLSITIHGLGGVTRHQQARGPIGALVVSLAGPAAGFGLAAAGLVLTLLSLPGLLGDAAAQLLFLNVLWSVFNLLPIYPLDGGNALSQVLQLVLAPGTAWPLTWGIGLVGAVALAIAALSMGEMFITLFAGSYAYQNFSMLQLWRSKVREAREAG